MSLPRVPPVGLPSLEELQGRNRLVVKTHKPLPILQRLPVPPRILIVTCLDPRCDPSYFWGIKPGEAMVVRNPGGRVSNDVRTLWFMDSLMEGPENFYVVHHTDCGVLRATQDGVERYTKAQNPNVKDADLEGVDFGAFTDVEQSVRDDLRFLRESPLVRKGLADLAQGFIFNIETGVVTPVKDVKD